MVARSIPWIMGLGALLAGFRLWGTDVIEQVIKRDLQDRYDIIIVGAGTSGAVLATRLSDDVNLDVKPDKDSIGFNSFTILLLEAGGDPTDHPDADIPIFADHMRGTEYDWQYQTVPQRHACKAHKDQVSVWANGKGLGGSSLLNYMLYLRGSRHDYDEWAMAGAHNWAYKDVLPYFIKSEDNRNPKFVRTVFHGYGGKMTIKDVNLSPTAKIAESAFQEMNVKKRDINGKTQFGFYYSQATIRSGRRWCSHRAFLSHVMHRDNLRVETHAIAQKILFDGKKAVGVQFMKDGKIHQVRASKEIILTAGTVGTTKLMLLSGIGPKNHLQAMKIPLVADLPVGDNLQDHVVAPPVEFYSPHPVSITAAKAENFRSAWAYTLWGGGMKQSPRFREAVAYVRTKYQPAHVRYPIIGLQVLANIGVYSAEDLRLKEAAYDALYSRPPMKEGFSILPILMHPKSKGTIRLRTSNPVDPPLINPNYLSEDADAKVLAEAIQYSRRLINTAIMDTWEVKLNDRLLPECKKFGNHTNTYYECLVRHITLPGNAPVGTCRMGAKGDPTAVVDTNLKVRGIKNLRIVDASVIPSAITGDTYATQIMMAEKLADTIKGIDSVERIREYYKTLIQQKHEKMAEEEHEHERERNNKSHNAKKA